MKTISLLVTLLLASSALANTIEIPTGEAVEIQALNTKCGTDHLPILEYWSVDEDFPANPQKAPDRHGMDTNRRFRKMLMANNIILKASCRPITCYAVFHKGLGAKSYRVLKSTYANEKELVADKLTKHEAESLADRLVKNRLCTNVVKQGRFFRILDSL